MSNIPVIDLIFVILIILMGIHGYVKGFVEELFSWASLVLGIWAAVMLYHNGAEIIRSKIMKDVRYFPEILAFIIIFLIVIIVLRLLEHVLKEVVSGANIKGVDKFLGLIIGLVEGFALTAVILFILSIQPLFDASKIVGNSIFAEIILPLIKIPLNRGRTVINTAFLFLPALRFPGSPVQAGKGV